MPLKTMNLDERSSFGAKTMVTPPDICKPAFVPTENGCPVAYGKATAFAGRLSRWIG